MSIRNGVQLITYPDSLGGNLKTLEEVLRGPLSGLFSSGVHILPPFPSSADRGFAPKTYFEIDPAFGTWQDIAKIGEHHDLTLDLMVNHISRQSPYFGDYAANGRESAWADLFMTAEKVWPDGDIPPGELALVERRRPGGPISEIPVGKNGAVERLWTTFGAREWSEQIDLDVNSPLTRGLFDSIFSKFAAHGVKMTRLDAVGYVIKKRGTNCFMVEPEIFDFLKWISSAAESHGIGILPEIHADSACQGRVAERGYYVYDFTLPAIVLHSFVSGSSARLRSSLRGRPRRQFTTLDCHDGIPIRPDLDGLLDVGETRRVIESCVARGANLSSLREGQCFMDGLDTHQVNCSYFDALGHDDDSYIAARAIQLFAPGIQQIYYVGLFAGQNDYGAMERTGVGRAVNRHDFTLEEIENALEKSVVRRLFRLIRFRNAHPAFDGSFDVRESDDRTLILEWRTIAAFCSLNVSFPDRSAIIRHSGDEGRESEWIP